MSPKGINRKRRGFAKLGAVGATVAASAIFAAPAAEAVIQLPVGNLPDLEQVDGLGLVNQTAQETNKPYLAWRGESVRLVECADTVEEATLFGLITAASVTVEDWTGDPHFKPHPQGIPLVPFMSGAGENARPCLAANLTSQHAGLAAVDLTITDLEPGVTDVLQPILSELEAAELIDIGQGNDVVLQSQQLVGWMTIGDTSLTNLGDGNVDYGNGPQVDGGEDSDDDQELQAKVTGTLPLENDFGSRLVEDSEGGLSGDSMELPTDYEGLAEAAATSAGNISGTTAKLLWDSHDGQTIIPSTNICVGGVPVGNTTNPVEDTVGDCESGNEIGRFSRILHDPLGGLLGTDRTSNQGTIGPFDPQRAGATMVGDGIINADDADMPALRLDWNIAEGGMGQLAAVDKGETFRAPFFDDRLDQSSEHDLFAPYYQQWIPAAGVAKLGVGSDGAGENRASGVDGPFTGRQFPGFLLNDPTSPYDNWDAYALREGAGGDTDCLRQANSSTGEGAYRDDINGLQKVATYTDEHGEARIAYDPSGAAWDEFIDENNGCDIEGVDLPDTVISAQPVYPYRPVSKTDSQSTTITNNNLFEKVVTVRDKNNVAGGVHVVTAKATDVDGSPMVGERVCFANESVASFLPYPGFPEVDVQNLSDWFCVITDQNGEAKAEFVSNGHVNDLKITAFFVDEALFRSSGITDLGGEEPTPGPQGPQGPQGPTGPTGNNTNTGSVTPAQQQQAAAVQAASLQVSAAGAKGASSKSVLASSKVKGGKLRVRVNGAASSAKLKIRLRGRSGKTLRTLTVSVPTNRTVTVKGLKISKKVRSVSASVVS